MVVIGVLLLYVAALSNEGGALWLILGLLAIATGAGH